MITPEVKLQVGFKDESERNFVMDSWLKNIKKSSATISLPSNRYYKIMRPIVERVLAQSEVILIVNPEDESQIFGYAAFRLVDKVPIISMVYVRSAYKTLGLGRKLFTEVKKQMGVEDGAVFATNCFSFLVPLFKKYNVHYDPFWDLQYIEREVA